MRWILSLLLCLPLVAGAAEHRIEHSASLELRPETGITIENLVGRVEIVRGDGDRIGIEAVVVAEARTPAAAEALARSVTLERDELGLWVAYPTGEHTSYIYRDDRGNSQSTLTYRGERVTVSGPRRFRGGTEVHTDLRITVPDGAIVSVNNMVGRIEASGITGEIAMATASGRIASMRGAGALTLRSGSGRLEVSEHNGSVHGRTGSGTIELMRVAGSSHELHSGSGSIRIDGVLGSLSLRTGSGSVRIEGISDVESLDATAGSGSIQVEGDLGALTDLRLRTGSGGIRVHSTTTPNLSLDASAGSGSVSVDAPGMRVEHTRRKRIEAALGTGEGKATLTTGSGSIVFRAGRG